MYCFDKIRILTAILQGRLGETPESGVSGGGCGPCAPTAPNWAPPPFCGGGVGPKLPPGLYWALGGLAEEEENAAAEDVSIPSVLTACSSVRTPMSRSKMGRHSIS